MRTFTLLVPGVCLVAGCANLGWGEASDPELTKQFMGIDMHSAFPITRRQYFERINLLELIDPDRMAQSKFKEAWDYAEKQPPPTGGTKDEHEHNKFGAWYDLSLAWFRQRTDISDEKKRMHRNSVQERMIAASVSRCNVFKTYLRRQQTDVNFIYGTLTTAAGALGAIATGVDASRLMAGAAGLFSGIRAEYNQTYYSNLAAHVIIKGIEVKQELVYRQIQSEGQTKSVDNYPMEAAIKDAMFFDGQCSTVTGLTQAGASIEATTEPGLEALTRGILRARIAKEAADMPRDQLLNPDTLRKLESAAKQVGISLVGSVRGSAVAPASETDPFVLAAKMVERVAASAQATGSAVEQAAIAKRKQLTDAVRKTDPKKADGYEKDAPKTGALADAVAKVVTDQLIGPMKLEQCYSQYVSPAVLKRETAIKARDAAKGADVVKAEFDLKEAARGIEAAVSQLSAMEQLVGVDRDVYQYGLMATINDAQTPDQLSAKLPGKLERNATTDKECKASATQQAETKPPAGATTK